MSAPSQSAEDGFVHRDYAAWNRAVGEVFFDGRFAHRPVYLDLEPETLAEVAASAGNDSDNTLSGLTAAVRETLYLGAHEPPLFDRHTRAVRAWIGEGRRGTPPFLALLAFLSSVAGGNEERPEIRRQQLLRSTLRAPLSLDLEGADRDRVARWFRAETPVFWRELNGWLEASEGRLGNSHCLRAQLASQVRRSPDLPGPGQGARSAASAGPLCAISARARNSAFPKRHAAVSGGLASASDSEQDAKDALPPARSARASRRRRLHRAGALGRDASRGRGCCRAGCGDLACGRISSPSAAARPLRPCRSKPGPSARGALSARSRRSPACGRRTRRHRWLSHPGSASA